MITSIKDIFLKEVDYTSLVSSIVGCWRKYAKFGDISPQYTEVNMLEFNTDGTGVWKQWNDSGFSKPHEDLFTYRVQGQRVIFSYVSFPEQYDVLDYRVANGHLILIDDYGMLDEAMEVYHLFLPHKRKQRKDKN